MGTEKTPCTVGRKAGLTCLLLLLAASASAVTPTSQKAISLDEALEIALQNHPRLKMANAEIERSRQPVEKSGTGATLRSATPGGS